MDPPPIELRPPRRLHAALLLLGCGMFVVAGAALIAIGATHLPAGIVPLLIGVLGIVFFGGTLITGLPDVVRGRSLHLDGRGIAIHRAGQTLDIGWNEVVAVGAFAIGRTRLVGLRLADPDAVAGRAPDAAAGGNRAARRLVAVTGAVVRPLIGDRIGRSAADVLRFNRTRYSYDVCLGWADRDRSAERLLELIERYRR